MGIFLALLILLLAAPDAVANCEHALLAYRGRDVKQQSAADSAIIWNNRGVDLFSSGKYQDAVKAYGTAIKFNPAYTDAYSNRGVAFDAMNQPARAVLDYSQAIRLNPRFAASYNNRASAYCDLGKFKESIADWNIVLSRRPRDANAHYKRGFCYESMGDLKSAQTDYEKAAALNPRLAKAVQAARSLRQGVVDGSARSGLAVASVGEGLAPKAARASRSDAELPYLPGSRFANVPTSAVKAPSASKTAPKTVVQQETSPAPTIRDAPESATAKTSTGPAVYCVSMVHHVLGNVCALSGQYDAAAKNFTTAISVNPKDQFAYYRRANAYSAGGQFSRAIADYDSALRINRQFKQAETKRLRLLERTISAPSNGVKETAR